MTGVRYLTPAVLELERACSLYGERSPRIAERFLDEVISGLAQLRAYPESGPTLVAPVRRKVLRKYPYSLLYYLKDGDIVVAAVMHHRQPPGHWRARVGLTDEA